MKKNQVKRKEKKGSLRRQFIIYTVLLFTLVIALFWLINVQLLEPLYNQRIENSLNDTMQLYSQIIEDFGDIEDEYSTDGINLEFFTLINEVAMKDEDLSGKCMDIANSSGKNILHMHQLASECLLHPTQEGMFGDWRDSDWNTNSTIALRLLTKQNGELQVTVTEGENRQRVLGQTAGDYIVLVSTDLQRIDEATSILQTQMPIIAAFILIIGVIAAYIFSHRMAKPISEISSAARKMAVGDYSARVQKLARGEIGTLADDFNTMANEVQRTSQLQNELLANISHDLRTPLTLIKGYAETVRDINGDNEDKRNSGMNIIIDESDRLSGLVNSVLELSKVSSKALQMNKVKFDIAQLCEESASVYEDICNKNNYLLEIKTPEVCEVVADAEQISRVLHNLLGNAVRHVGPDGYIGIECLKLNGKVRIMIKDHGIGIPPEELPHLFDRYYRTRASAGKTGTGLGLSIAKAILENHNFNYGVISEVGKGSEFWFEIIVI